MTKNSQLLVIFWEYLACAFIFGSNFSVWWNSLMFWFSNSMYICIVDRKGSVAHERMQYMDFEGAWMWIYIIFVCMCARIFRCLSVCARCSIWQYNDFIHTWCISVQCQYGYSSCEFLFETTLLSFNQLCLSMNYEGKVNREPENGARQLGGY